MSNRSNIIRTLAAALAVAAGLCAPAARASAPADGCYTDWSTAVPVVQREALTAVREIHNQARQRNVGDVVRVTLCTEQGRFVYRLLVREPKGQIVPMTVDARRPFE